MAGIIFQTEKNHVGFITQEQERESMGQSVKNNIFRWLWVEDEYIEKLDCLYCQKKIPEFTDMIMNLLSDHRR
jgi:hypothetical protein